MKSSLAVLLSCGLPLTLSAQVLNNIGFESGTLTGWTVGAGSNATVVSAPTETLYFANFTGTGPVYGWDYVHEWDVTPAGTRFLQLAPGTATVADMASALGVSEFNFGFNVPNATNASYVYQDLSLTVGDTVTFHYLFMAQDYNPYNDGFFFTIDGPDLLSNTELVAAIFVNSVQAVADWSHTGWQSYSYGVPLTGDYRFGFGVVNVLDSILPSYVFIDDAAGGVAVGALSAVPEPATVAVWLGAAAGLGAMLRRRRRTGWEAVSG